jgi:hypothetical protein
VNELVGKTNISAPEIWTFSLSQLTVSDVKRMDLLANIYVSPTGRS